MTHNLLICSPCPESGWLATMLTYCGATVETTTQHLSEVDADAKVLVLGADEGPWGEDYAECKDCIDHMCIPLADLRQDTEAVLQDCLDYIGYPNYTLADLRRATLANPDAGPCE